jgi:hypothetical protein
MIEISKKIKSILNVGMVYTIVALLCMNILYVIYYAYARDKVLKMEEKGRRIFIRFSIFSMFPFILSAIVYLFSQGEAAGWAMGFAMLTLPYFIYHLYAVIYFNRPDVKVQFKQ